MAPARRASMNEPTTVLIPHPPTKPRSSSSPVYKTARSISGIKIPEERRLSTPTVTPERSESPQPLKDTKEEPPLPEVISNTTRKTVSPN
ncbi:hypothetical protein HDU76_012069, partial [Blyttiomyces sp. JEL0837]